MVDGGLVLDKRSEDDNTSRVFATIIHGAVDKREVLCFPGESKCNRVFAWVDNNAVH